MVNISRRIKAALAATLALLGGCATRECADCRQACPAPSYCAYRGIPASDSAIDKGSGGTTEDLPPASPHLPGSDPPPAFSTQEPVYARTETLPIDLPTVLRMVDSTSPAVAVSRARVREAMAREDQAQVLWLPNLTGGVAYNRFDGQTQNQRGEIFGKSRSNLFGGGGPQLSVDFADALYQPLIARRELSAARYAVQAETVATQLSSALAYLDLLQAHAMLAVNADTILRLENLVRLSTDATETGANRSATDINRARTELALRKAENADFLGREGAMAARLGKLLQLDPSVRLMPADASVVPVALIDEEQTIEELVAVAISNRDDLAAHRQLVSAAWERVRKSQAAPFIPKLIATDQGGTFGGGVNSEMGDFAARNALNVQLYWELKNLGIGNRAATREREAMTDKATFQLAELQVRIIAEVAEAARVASAKQASFEPTRGAILESLRWYDKSIEIARNATGRRGEFDSLEPLRSIQALTLSRTNYLSAVVEYNRMQYRLFALLGYPACRAPLDGDHASVR